jgi:hypothetical protein
MSERLYVSISTEILEMLEIISHKRAQTVLKVILRERGWRASQLTYKKPSTFVRVFYMLLFGYQIYAAIVLSEEKTGTRDHHVKKVV